MEDGITVRDVAEILSVTMQAGEKLITTGFRIIEGTSVMAAKMMNTLYLSKWKGKTSLNRFRAIKGEEMQFMCIYTEEPERLKEIFKEMEKHGILTARLPDLCTGDGTIQFVYSPSDASKMEAFLINHSKGKNQMIKIEPTTASAYHRSGIRDGNPTPELSALENSAEKVIKKGKITGQERLALPGPDHKTISVEKTSVLWSHSRLMALSVPGQKEALLIGKEDVKESDEKNLDITIRSEEYYQVLDKLTGELSMQRGEALLGQMVQPTVAQKKEQLQEQLNTVNKDLGKVTRITIHEKMFLEKFDPSKETFRTRIPYSQDIVTIPTRHCRLMNEGKILEVYLYDHMDYIVDRRNGEIQCSGVELRRNYDDKSREQNQKRVPYGESKKTVQSHQGNTAGQIHTEKRKREKTPVRKR